MKIAYKPAEIIWEKSNSFLKFDIINMKCTNYIQYNYYGSSLSGINPISLGAGTFQQQIQGLQNQINTQYQNIQQAQQQMTIPKVFTTPPNTQSVNIIEYYTPTLREKWFGK